MGDAKSINEEQSCARDWEWVEARERVKGKGEIKEDEQTHQKMGHGLSCDENSSPRVGFQLCRAYLIQHRLNVTFTFDTEKEQEFMQQTEDPLIQEKSAQNSKYIFS